MGLTQALGYVTTASALLAIAFPPLMGVTIGLTAASLVVHTVEYEAGEASLVDIGLDIAALLCFGRALKVTGKLEQPRSLIARRSVRPAKFSSR